ncbi:zinc finger MYM-type protein 2 isoform X2 [Dunckerocampus dactyliophorus]|uniref:zinc finger MYM-type protein 2 isoform X2 n=1 Tax=Dunckerocampus dactyliophorus TaxID=161453 RepID=UPI00240585C2|nr:zinc finger MYM-type protein 2 isoform X2 [Dunckerocampus dactyliophorus]
MDGELEPNPAVAEGVGEPEEHMDATPSPCQQATPPIAAAAESVSMATDDDAPRKGCTDDDDDVVLVDEEAPKPPASTSSQDTLVSKDPEPPAATADMSAAATPTSIGVSESSNPATTEPIVIDDEEESEEKQASSPLTAPTGGSSPGTFSTTDPNSDIQIANVTTLGQKEDAKAEPSADAQADLMITSVTSLQGGSVACEGRAEENGLQICSAFSLNTDNVCGKPSASFNPGRGSTVQNGDAGTHNRTDSWISQSASVPRNQKQTGVDSPSPATSLPKPPGQSSSSSPGSQPQPRTVKVTCANCKKPLKKGQTAYQRKGSTHLFCSTTCLSAFSHKPAPKKSCTMCKKDITNMKGTIVAQVDSSESFQEFCSTGCLGAYENKQNPPKSSLKTKCTVCGKLTEIRHEVSFKTVTHKICSDICFNVYRRANGLIMNCCEQCGDYLPSRVSANHFLLVDGQQKRFCCQNCIRDYKQAHSKLASCLTCKTLIKTGEVVLGLGADGAMGSYCSANCMNKAKLSAVNYHNAEPTCHFCKRNSLPQYQATLPEGNVLNFCSSQCVTKFQNTTLQTATNGQTPLSTTNSAVQLKCNYCRGTFSMKPQTLEWEDKVYHFCSKVCCDDYKKLHCIVTLCEYCQEEKTLHDTVKFSGEKKPFCSEGCKLLYKQDFIKRLGLKCVSCNNCNQLCKRAVTRQLGGMTRDFCSDECSKKFDDWYHKAARCDCCKVQGQLTESVMWRSELKHFCDQQCLLRFYCQQNEPIMATQKGPENSITGTELQGSKLGLVGQGTYTGSGLMRDVKNKAVLCKPLTLTKATYCKPHMQSKPIQTDVDDGVKREYVPVPIPVPVFIPMPMNMYSQVTPTPLSMPLPLPVPFFLPTTLQGADQIVQAIKELKGNVPSDLAEMDLLAEVEKQKPDVKPVEVKSEHEDEEASKTVEDDEEGKYEPDMDLEVDFPQALDPLPVPEAMDEDVSSALPPVLAEEREHTDESIPRPQPRTRGSKRLAVEEGFDQASPSPPTGRSLPLKARYGINAWKRWALSAYDQTDDGNKDSSSEAAPGARLTSNLASLSAEELNMALSRFVREACRPSGERYSPDSILYLCLGIQQHLHTKGRKDDLFSDICYQQFGEELNKVLKDWKPSVLLDGSLWGRVEEQSLWSSRQLGDQTPASLLRSLVYLNTKYLGLRTAEQHMRLSFANVYGPDTVHPVLSIKSTSTCIRVPSVSQDHNVVKESRKRKLDDGDCEAGDDTGPRVPIRKHERHLYELYRSKCPPLLQERSDVFYVQPDPTCDPNGMLWFTSTPMEPQMLESLLARVLLVRDVYTDTPRLEEEKGEEGGDEGE